MRAALAILAATLVLLSAAAPHHHSSVFGTHECAACVAKNGESACSQTPDMAPDVVLASAPAPLPGDSPVSGAPLGSVPGQSPPSV